MCSCPLPIPLPKPLHRPVAIRTIPQHFEEDWYLCELQGLDHS